MQSAFEVVHVGDGGVAAAEPERGLAFPVVEEAVDLVEFDGAVRIDEVVEHAYPPHGSELHRVADQGDAPASVVGELGKGLKSVSGEHGGFVDNDGSAGREVVSVVGWPIEGVFGEELVDDVGGNPRLGRQYVGGGGRWCDAERGAGLGSELLDCWG